MQDNHCDLRIQVQSTPTFVCAVRAALDTAAQQAGLDDKARGHITLAITEAMVNIINHGYKGQNDQPIWITFRTITKDERKGVQIILEDESPQIDLDKIRSRPLEEYRPGGLGVHLIREVMQDVAYAHRDGGKGLRLTMNKFPTPDTDTPAPTTTAASASPQPSPQDAACNCSK